MSDRPILLYPVTEPTKPQCPSTSPADPLTRCVVEEGHGTLLDDIAHNFWGSGPYTPTVPAPNATQYRIHGKGEPVIVVTSSFLEGIGLAEGWVWLLTAEGTKGGYQAAHRDWLVPVLTTHDMRTVSGGVTLRHGVVKDWVEDDQRWEIPTVDIELSRGGIVLRLRRADITEIRHVLGKMLAEMPPDPLMPG